MVGCLVAAFCWVLICFVSLAWVRGAVGGDFPSSWIVAVLNIASYPGLVCFLGVPLAHVMNCWIAGARSTCMRSRFS